MSNNARVLKKFVDVARMEFRNLAVIEILERLAKVFTFPQDRQPAKSGLESFQTDFFEQPTVVVNRISPFVIVVLHVIFVSSTPPAAAEFIVSGE